MPVTEPDPITALPTAPSRLRPRVFNSEASGFLAALPALGEEMQSTAEVTYSNALIVEESLGELAETAHLVPATYASGISLTLPVQTVERSGIVYAPLLSALPFTTSNWATDAAKFRVVQGVTQLTLETALEWFYSTNRKHILEFLADPTGAADSTAEFLAAVAYSAAKGGCRFYLGHDAAFKLTDLVIDERNTIFEGDTSGFSYERFTDVTKTGVRLIPGAAAKFVVRLKGSNSGNVAAAAQGSGLRNLVVIDTSQGEHDYGLVIDSAATVVEHVTIQDFKYNFAAPAALNANLFRKVGFLGATKVGFAVTEEDAIAYIHPDLTGVPVLASTLFQMEGCVIRQNEFGVVLRDCIGSSLGDTVIESNRQHGLVVFRADSSTVRALTLRKVWLENNYDAFTPGDLSTYVVTGNRMFLLGNSSTYIPWTASDVAGYQALFDSQTRTGTGGSDSMTVYGGGFNCGSADQRAIRGLSGVKFKFYDVAFTGGDTPNLIKFTSDVQSARFVDPIPGNDPTAYLTCISGANRANMGTDGIYEKDGVIVEGTIGGALYVPAPVAGNPINQDPRVLTEFRKLTHADVAIIWRLASVLNPFTITSVDIRGVKKGCDVSLWVYCTLTANATSAGADKLYANGQLPYTAQASGHTVGTCYVTATGGSAAAPPNDGISPIRLFDANSLISVLNVFPTLVVGNVFRLEVNFSYPAVEV